MNVTTIKSWSKYLGLFLALSILTACSTNTLTFIDETEIPYQKDFNTCSLVSEINHQGIPSLLNDGNQINYDGLTVVCNSNNVELVENELIEIQFEMDSNVFTKSIRFISDTATNSSVEESPQTESTTEIVEESPQTETSTEPAEETSQAETPTEVVEESPQKETTQENVEESPHIETPSNERVGVHKEFRVSETVNQNDAQSLCVQYAKQYTNFTGCVRLRDPQTQLIIGFKTQ